MVVSGVVILYIPVSRHGLNRGEFVAADTARQDVLAAGGGVEVPWPSPSRERNRKRKASDPRHQVASLPGSLRLVPGIIGRQESYSVISRPPPGRRRKPDPAIQDRGRHRPSAVAVGAALIRAVTRLLGELERLLRLCGRRPPKDEHCRAGQQVNLLENRKRCGLIMTIHHLSCVLRTQRTESAHRKTSQWS